MEKYNLFCDDDPKMFISASLYAKLSNENRELSIKVKELEMKLKLKDAEIESNLKQLALRDKLINILIG